MVQIYEDQPGFANKILSNLQGASTAFGKEYLGQHIGQRQQQQQNEAFQKLTGVDLGQLPPEMRQEFVKEFAKSEAKQHLLKNVFSSQKQQPFAEQLSAGKQPMQEEGTSDLLNLGPEGRMKLGLVDPNLAKLAVEEEKLKEKRTAEQAKRHFAIAEPFLKNVSAKAEELPQKESALQTMVDAIDNRDLGFFSKDNLAEITGIEGLRSPEGAIFKTAGKEFFLGTLKSVGAKGLNQWLERQVTDMLPKLGRSTEANLVVTEALKTELDVQKKQIEIANRIHDQQEAKYGYPKQNISTEVNKELSKYAIEKQKELKDTIENIKERFEPVNKQGFLMRAPDGSLRRVSKADQKAALKAGYRKAE